MKKSQFVLIVFSFLCTINIFAQNTIKEERNIKGIVIDKNKQPIEGVNIYLPEVLKGTVSDKDGKFLIENISNKKVKAQFSILGYETLVIDISNESAEIVLHNSIIEIEEVVISGGFVNTADRSAVKIESIPLEELAFNSSPSLTLALADEPSVEMVKLGNAITKPVIRGLSGNRVVVLYQGARVSNQAWGEEHGVFIPEEGIENVEIVKGPASLLFGADAMGGVLNFIPLKPLLVEGRKSKFSTSFYSANSGVQSSFVSQKRKKSWFHTYGLGYQNHADYKLPNGDFAHNSRYNQHYAFGNWGVTKDWGILKGVYSSSYTNTGLVEGIATESEREMEKPWQQVGDHFVTAEGVFWHNDWTLKPFVSYQLNHRKEFEEEHDEHEEEHDEAALDMMLRTTRFDFKALKSNNNYEFILGSQGMYQMNNNDEHAHEILIPNAETKDLSLYTLMNKRKGNLQLQTGVRADFRKITFLDKEMSFLDYTYSLGSTYNLSERYVFRANVAKGYRPPNLYELSADGEHHGADRYEKGDENLKSENNLETDLSLHIHGKHYSFDVAIFNNKIDDYIYLASTSDTTDEGMTIYEHHQDDARLYGGEAGIDLHPHFMHNLHLKSTISVVYADNLALDEPLEMTPPAKWNNEVEYVFNDLSFADKLRLALNYNHHFAQDRISSMEDITASYSLINASFGLEKGRHQFSIHAQNLMNVEYIPHLSLLKEQGVFEQGRSVSLKYSVKF
ncbi:MAG: TonB-dependent receptor [Flavobacteriales bacterium]|nr:TonB-dependent receptor [Flavobacteriales bacterium]